MNVGVYPQRINNSDSLGNNEANLFYLKDTDKFQEFKRVFRGDASKQCVSGV